MEAGVGGMGSGDCSLLGCQWGGAMSVVVRRTVSCDLSGGGCWR